MTKRADKQQIVSRHPEVVSGALVFAGARVPVRTLIDHPIRTLIDHLKGGETLGRFLAGFPAVRREQVEAYLEMALADPGAHA